MSDCAAGAVPGSISPNNGRVHHCNTIDGVINMRTQERNEQQIQRSPILAKALAHPLDFTKVSM